MPFPQNPGQYKTYVDYDSKREWIWDGRKWILIDSSLFQARGPQGQIGATGSTGPDGAKGATGSTGNVGPQGDDGPPGERGPDGVRGEKGPAGIQGGALCSLVIEPPADGGVRGALYLSSWNEVYVSIG